MGINQFNDTAILISLEPNLEIPELIVYNSKSGNLETASTLNISPSEINRMPSFFGERDILRTIQLKPGVQMGKEGSTGLVVRGGGPDQNMYVVDGVPLYYVQHMGNLLSTFNADAIKSATIIKGGFPARYGGRLSSITDIRIKDGNNKVMKGSFTLGMIAVKGYLEGPINDKTTYLLSARRCNLDLITRPLSLLQSDGEGMAGYTFYDANLKIRHQVDQKNALYVSLFTNRDKLFLRFWDNDTIANKDYNFSNILHWGNYSATVRWNHVYNSNHIGDFSVSHSFFNYSHSIKLKAESQDNPLFSHEVSNGTSINESIAKYEHNYYFNNKLTLRFGGGLALHHFNPHKNITGDSIRNNPSIIPELNGYLEVIYCPIQRIKLNLGYRHTIQLMEGNWMYTPEPRISLLTRIIPDHLNLSISYSRMSQNVHLISDNSGGIPVDIWLPASNTLPQESSDQVSLGISHHFAPKYGLSLSLEGFIKKQNNLVELRPGNNILYVLNNTEKSLSTGGTGSIYGLDFSLEKKRGSFTGWISYMYIINRRQFDDINQGKTYPYIYDKPHNLSVIVMTKLSNRIRLSASWQISSGNLFTLAEGEYTVPVIYFGAQSINGEAHLYGEKNSTRLNPYHRLDVSLDFHKRLINGTRIFNISLYNAYNKQNPFFLFYMKNDNGESTLRQLCMFPLIPSLSYRYDF